MPETESCVTQNQTGFVLSSLIFVQYLFIYIFYLTENCGCHDDTVTNSHKQELVFLCTEVYRTQSHEYTKITLTKTNVTISLVQPNDISMGRKVFNVLF